MHDVYPSEASEPIRYNDIHIVCDGDFIMSDFYSHIMGDVMGFIIVHTWPCMSCGVAW